MPVPPRDVLLDLLRLDEAEAAARAQHARDPQYWRRLAPGLHVCDPAAAIDRSAPDLAAVDAAQAALAAGACHVRGVFADEVVARANGAVDVVVAAGWPAAFAFVYDELWLLARAPLIVAMARRALGSDCGQIPHAWVHVVPPGGRGWTAHTDGPAEGRLTAWVALTDAGLDNGCMYVIDRDAAPDDIGARVGTSEMLTGAEAQRMLHGVRALPAAAGDVLGWRFDIVHWGGRADPSAPGRRGVSLEFIAASERARDDERPPIPLDALPPLDLRLRAIAGGVLGYGATEPLMTRFEELARRIMLDVDDRGACL